MPKTPRDDALLPVVEDLVERQRQILGALVATTHPLKNDVQAVLLGMRGVVTKLRNGAAEADATTPTNPDDLRDQIRSAISDPGAFLPKYGQSKGEPFETVAGWGSRAVLSVIAPVLEGLRAERDSERESRIAWALEADRLQQIADRAVVPADAVQQLVNAAEGVQGIKEQHASEELADMFRAVLRSWQAQPASDPWTAPIKGNVEVRPSASGECDCYPKLHASYPNAKAYVCPTCGSQWAPKQDGHGRWLWLHKPAPASDQTPATPDVGRCGEPAPRLSKYEGPRVWYALPAGHAGWHKADDSREWSRTDAAPSSVQDETTPGEEDQS